MPTLIATVAQVAVASLFRSSLLQFISVVLLNVITSKLFGPKIPSSIDSLASKSILRRSAVEYRKIIYGEASVSGPVIYNNLSGENGEYLWFVLAMADGEVDSLTSVWLDGDEIPEADITWTPGIGGADGSGTGNVSTAKWIGENSRNAVQIFYTLGHADQVVMAKINDVFTTDWSDFHRLRGIAYVVVKLLYNQDTETVWEGGAPNNIKAVMKGRKVYDPRMDSTRVIDSTTSPITYGSGVHRVDSPSTWEWSDNPALCIADYLVMLMNVSATTGINWETIAASADDCDVQVLVPPDDSPSHYETRFTCNGVLSMGASHKDNLDSLLSSCDGKLSYSEGKWRLRVSVWEASSVSFDEDDLAGPVEVRGSAPKAERFNTVRGVYVDPDRNYQPVEFPHITHSTYVTRDAGRTLTRDLELPMTNSATMAQRIAIRLLEQSNNQIIAKIRTNARGAKSAIGDVVSLTVNRFSWSAKTFRVIEWQRNQDGTFDMTLREDFAVSYDDPTIADYTTGNAASTTVPVGVVPPPTNISVSSVPYAIRITWTNPAVGEFDFIDVYASATSAWSGATRVASVRTDTYTFNVGSGTTRYFWIRARRNSGDVSTRLPNSDTSTIVGTSGSGTDSVNLTGAIISDELVTAGNAEVAYRLTSGGLEQSYEGSPASPIVWDTISTWLLAGAAGDYDCRLSKVSGTDPTTGTLATWQDSGTTREWVWTDTTEGSPVSFVGTVEVRDGTSLDVLASGTLTVSVDKQAPSVSLSGSAVSPNLASQINDAGWRFNSDGTVDRRRNGTYSQYNSSTEWIIPNSPSGTYHIRFTLSSGDAADVGTIGSWIDLSTSPQFYWNGAEDDGTMRVEISNDASPIGSDIVATGYYRGLVVS